MLPKAEDSIGVMATTRPLRTAADDDIFIVTEKGMRELKAAGTSLSTDELQLLVVVDGFSPVAQLSQRVPGISRAQMGAVLDKLLAARLIVSAEEPDSDVMGSGFSTIAIPAGFFSGLTESMEADGGAAILKKKGYYVRIAKLPAGRRDAKSDWKPIILIVDDDTDVQKLIRTYFKMEGFKCRSAFKRDDILIALRQQPAPDLILLDVQLPDANGFDLLARMRQHPVLKGIPVVMLTAETTREAVLRGLQGGADGYITKPFDPDLLVSAVKAVLGLFPPPGAKKQ
jgi:two-component system OmpR family response regulator